jgi:elongation factor G
MKQHSIDQLRNIGLVAHGDAGKTSLAEAMLYTSGASDRLGKVGDVSCVMDYDPDEIKRGITINASLAFCEWNNHKINIVDTPGYVNFIAETQGSMRVIDTAIVVISADEGVQVITEKVWKWAEEKALPCAIFVNKLGHERANLTKVLDDIEKTFKKKAVKFQVPIGSGANFKGVVDLIKMKSYSFSNDQSGKTTEGEIPSDLKDETDQYREELIEAAAETNDELTEKYLEEGSLTEDEIKRGLKAGINNATVIPIFYGSALNNHGVSSLLDIIVEYLPSPDVRPPMKGKDDSEKEVVRQNSPDEPLSALVFKTIADPYAGQLTLFRTYSGVLKADSVVLNSSKESKEKLGSLFCIQGKNQTSVPSISAGDFGVVAKLKNTVTGDTFTDDKKIIIFEPIKFPQPVLSLAVVPKKKQDEEKLSSSLHRLEVEEPTLQVSRDPQTNELIISGMGQLHLEVIVARLQRKFGVEVETKTPKIPYKETIRGTTKVQGKYKKQSGGRGQYGDTWLELSPLPKGDGFKFINKIVGGSIPRQYIPAVEKGIIEAMSGGVLAGYPLVDVQAILYDGSFHEVDSSEMAFKIAGSMGFKKGVTECKPVLLEPVMSMEITVPGEMMGDVIGDINQRRGKVLGVDPAGGSQLIKANVPMAEVSKYAPDLRALTGGRGIFTMEFSHYEEVPRQLTDKIIEQSKKEKE